MFGKTWKLFGLHFVCLDIEDTTMDICKEKNKEDLSKDSLKVGRWYEKYVIIIDAQNNYSVKSPLVIQPI